MCMSYSEWLDTNEALHKKELLEKSYDDMDFTTFGYLKKQYNKEAFVNELMEAEYNEYYQEKLLSGKDFKYKE